MRHEGILDRHNTAVLVIDVQERLLDVYAASHARRVVDQTAKLIRGAELFDVPILATEQYPKGIGPTHRPVRAALNDAHAPIIKDTMSCCGCPTFMDALRQLQRRQVVVCGIETHVCVLQTALDLQAHAYQVHLCTDATGSRKTTDYKTAIRRMGHDGVVLTTVESALFQLLGDRRDPGLKPLLQIIK